MWLSLPEVFIFLYCFKLPFTVLSFHPEGFPLAFLIGKSTGNELPVLLFIWKCLNFSLILEGWFFQIQNSCLIVFSFKILNISSHCFLASIVSEKKSTVNITENTLFVVSHFSLAAFKISRLSLDFHKLTIMCFGMDLFEFILLRIF